MNQAQKAYYLQQMGIQAWQQKNVVSVDDAVITANNSNKAAAWEQLEAQVRHCTACELHKTRTKTVFGAGNRQAELMIIGEAPGASEDQQGLPFVGRAGQLLTNMLIAIGIKREDVYITNILKSRPPNNRDPRPEEVAACTPFLLRQVELVSPKMILAVGRISAHYLLTTKATLGSLRGRFFEYGQSKTPLLVTYHPAYLLRAPRDKRKAYQDLQMAAKFMQSIPD